MSAIPEGTFVILDEHGARTETPAFKSLSEAMPAARKLGTKNVVVQAQGKKLVPMAYQGPMGWYPRTKRKNVYGNW